MSKKTITVCDGCGKELDKISKTYHLPMKTDRFWDSVEMDYCEVNLEFCETCAKNIKNTLNRIAENLNK